MNDTVNESLNASSGLLYKAAESSTGESIMWTFLIIMGLTFLIYMIQAFSASNNKAPRYEKLHSKTFNRNKFLNHCGVEIECIRNSKSVTSNSLLKNNFIKGTDSSINKDGYEFRSSPANGDMVFEMIEGFSKELGEKKYSVDKSCGLHIHIETKPDLELIKKIYAFYSKYEGLFFAMLPKSRQKNKHCSKFRDLDDYSWKEVLKAKDINQFKKLFYGSIFHFREGVGNFKKRYCWINIHSIFYRGTLEVRAHSGTMNSTKIKNWLLMHLIIREFLENNTLERIKKLNPTKKNFLDLFPVELQRYIEERWFVFPDIAEENFKEYN